MLFLSASLYGQTKPPFDQWLAELRDETLSLGISANTVELAFSEITPPVQRIIQSDRSQPEVVQTYEDYLQARVSQWKIDNGRQRMETHRATLDQIGDQFGVQPRFIMSIWGMETNFGTYPITESLFNVLATLAYDNRRAEFFRAQFIAGITMLDSGFPTYENMKSSWAGAMGQSQFIPESYLRYAVDHDGDGKKDIWNSETDVFASIANYFKSHGWQNDHTWGRKVLLPAGDEESLAGAQSEGLTPESHCRRYGSLGAWRDLQQWQTLGIRREDGTDLPSRSIPAALVLADRGDNEAYLVYPNFCSIMSYNPAFKYALSIGLLANEFED
jgi:membrane-bound lytic murein transglycosylase B